MRSISMGIALLAAAAGVTVAFTVSAANAQKAGPTVAGCPVFPEDNVWNARIDGLPLHPNSQQFTASIARERGLKADFGSGLIDGASIGIPFVVVPMNQPKVAIHFRAFGDEPPYASESDPGPYPVPKDAPIEGGLRSKEDRHVIIVQKGSCTLFELYKAAPNSDGSWNAVGAVKFDLEANDLRPNGWTSADAAGLPIFPGLVRYEEILAGEIRHALRFTLPRTRKAYVWPARHAASRLTDTNLPPLGLRLRLRADFDISRYSPINQIILKALKAYGMILADNGSPMYLSGAPNEAWNNDQLRELLRVKPTDFEAVDTSGLMQDENSARVRKP